MLQKPFAFLFCMGLQLQVAFASPHIEVPEPEFSFGERRSGEKVEHSFLIQNTGDETLLLKGIRASCGCTTPQERTMRIAPGESASLPVVIDLTGRVGPQNQFVSFNTNDPEQRHVSLRLSGTSLADITVEPRTLNLGQVDPGTPTNGQIRLTSTTGEAFEITRATANKDRVRIEVNPADEGVSAVLKVTPLDQASDGQFTDVVMIQTSNDPRKTERVLVMWQVNTGVTVTPGQVNLVVADRPQILNRYLMVKGYPGMNTPLEVLGVRWPEHPEVEITFSDTGRFGWRIHLKNVVPVESMDETELVVETNADGFETLRVPVRVLQ